MKSSYPQTLKDDRFQTSLFALVPDPHSHMDFADFKFCGIDLNEPIKVNKKNNQ